MKDLRPLIRPLANGYFVNIYSEYNTVKGSVGTEICSSLSSALTRSAEGQLRLEFSLSREFDPKGRTAR